MGNRSVVLAAGLENQRLREALINCSWRYLTDEKETCECMSCGGQWKFRNARNCYIDRCPVVEALSSPDHSQVAALYLELREKAIKLETGYGNWGGHVAREWIDGLRDILKRIEEAMTPSLRRVK